MKQEMFNLTIANMFAHLSSLVSTGVPLLKSIQAVAGEMEPPVRSIALVLEASVRNGTSFGDSVAYLQLLPDEAIDYLKAAETKGKLDVAFKTVSEDISIGVYTPVQTDKVEALMASIDTHYQEIQTTVLNLIQQGFQARASDLHLEPTDTGGRIRFRIDGVLKPAAQTFDSRTYKALVARLKDMSKLDIAETRFPQDGRILMDMVHDHDTASHPGVHNPIRIDLRVSACPFVNGEKMVCRYLDKSAMPANLESIHISADKVKKLRNWISRPFGTILVSGPTGSGKTTTLYLLLKELAEKDQINVITAEDPVEMLLPNTYQMQIKNSMGLTYSAAIRSIMRQDPDVVGIGEIQTPEVAELIIQVAQTGHLTLSQLHARSATATLKLMADLGTPVHALRDTMIGVVSQRLVRRLCDHCKQPVTPDANQHLPPLLATCERPIYQAAGCEKCNHTGYRGRTVVMELLEPTKALWDALAENAHEDQLDDIVKDSMTTMLDDGYQRVLDGETSLKEIHRVLM